MKPWSQPLSKPLSGWDFDKRFPDGHAVLFKCRDDATIRMGRLAAQGQTASFGPGCLGPIDARFMAAGYVCTEWPPAWLRDIR
jgi:hypothetical protein